MVARAAGDCQGYLTEEQAKDYPEGRYELDLQIAAEADDQAGLEHLFARRSRAQVLRMGLILLAIFSLVVLGIKVLAPPPEPLPAPASGAVPPKLDLPPARDFHDLNEEERKSLTDALQELANEVGVAPLGAPVTPERLIEAIDAKLGTPEAARDPGTDLTDGPPLRRLRALLWKHGLPEYRERRLNGG